MAFPSNLTSAVDGVTDVVADHLNNLEAKVGINGSLVTTSLDYLLRNPASVNPGHTHSYQVIGNYITTLTGDVAATGPGSAVATVQAGAVNLSKMANLAANSIIGNNTGSSATPLALTATQVKSLLAIAQGDVAGLTTTSSPTFAGCSINKSQNGNTNFSVINATNGTSAVADIYVGTGTKGLDISYRAAAYTGDPTLADAGVLRTDSTVTGGLKFVTGGAYPITFGPNGVESVRFASGGNVGVGTTSPNAAALLHLSSTTKGFLPPVMTTAQKTTIGSPPAGLIVYDSTLNKLCVYTGAGWQTITSA